MIPRFILLTLLFLLFISNVFALDITLPNNKFGIHLAVPNKEDIKKAAELVNSTGGKWGYVTVVIQENDRSFDKWQETFDLFRRYKLIPIVRIATQPEGANWKKPKIEDADQWASFLDHLNWVIKDRYVILFNEPNHASEWGGDVNTKEYANISYEFAKKLKEKNKDFFIMLAGFDASAPSSYPNFEDEGYFVSQMFFEKPELFSSDLISGWVSHSYANPGFSGSPYDRGRGTVSNYQWELEYLKQLGIMKDLPVFITETGWPHNENLQKNNYPTPEITGENLKIAFQDIWLQDTRVVAVTPFVLSYETEPFAKFSWKKPNSNEYFPNFKIIKDIQKIKGEPEQLESGEITQNLPVEILVNSTYYFTINIYNFGQPIWDAKDNYKIDFDKKQNISFDNYFFSDINETIPGKNTDVNLFIKTGQAKVNEKLNIVLMKNNKEILKSENWKFKIIPLPSLNLKVNFFPKLKSFASNAEIQIYDKSEKLVFKKSGIDIKNSIGKVSEIRNIYNGGKYRVVILVPYYLPRQNYLVFKKDKNEIKFKKMYPLDFDADGNFDFKDLWTLLKRPWLFRLFSF
jgi:hypothetical protein